MEKGICVLLLCIVYTIYVKGQSKANLFKGFLYWLLENVNVLRYFRFGLLSKYIPTISNTDLFVFVVVIVVLPNP